MYSTWHTITRHLYLAPKSYRICGYTKLKVDEAPPKGLLVRVTLCPFIHPFVILHNISSCFIHFSLGPRLRDCCESAHRWWTWASTKNQWPVSRKNKSIMFVSYRFVQYHLHWSFFINSWHQVFVSWSFPVFSHAKRQRQQLTIQASGGTSCLNAPIHRLQEPSFNRSRVPALNFCHSIP